MSAAPAARSPHAAAPRAAVIGSGFGGLALAARLQANGVRTVLFEANDRPGGSARVRHDKGYTFDAGPTVITDHGAIDAVFREAGRSLHDVVRLLPVDPFYRLVWPDGAMLDYGRDSDAIERQIAALSPTDVEGYRRFLAHSEALLDEGYVRRGSEPFLTLGSMARAGPKMLALRALGTVDGAVSRFISHPRLRQAFAFHALLIGASPHRASSIYALIPALERRWGVFHARGGTGAIVSALVDLIRDLGGEVRLNAPVERIATEGDRATGVVVDGRHEPFDLVASNANIVHTYGALLGHHPVGRMRAKRLEAKQFSMSLFVVYFGVRRRYPGLHHHTILFSGNDRADMQAIHAGRIPGGDLSIYLHAPSVTDESLAPPGCSAFYALTPVPHLGAGDIDWATEAPRLRDRILATLEARFLPGLRQGMETCSVFTPLDFKGELNSHLGSAFSLEPILLQSAWFRPHNRDGAIRNLYLVGAGTHPGAGLPGVFSSAKATAGLMLADAAALTDRTSDRGAPRQTAPRQTAPQPRSAV